VTPGQKIIPRWCSCQQICDTGNPEKRRSAFAGGGAQAHRIEAENSTAFLPLAFQTSAAKTCLLAACCDAEIANCKKRQ